MSGKFALVIGNTEYTDPGLAQLTAPGKDAEGFARVLQDRDLCAFDEVRVLVNQLHLSVIEAVDEFFDQRKPDDLLVLYFSGHGIRDESGSLYLAFKNTIHSRLRSTAIKSDTIREAMDQSRSKRQVLVLDCCNSGAFPQGTKAELGGAMGMMNAFQGYGRYVLTASDATQFAWEGEKVIGETDNSLFTHFLIKGLEGEADHDGDGKISVDELYDYAFEQISQVTLNQTPTKSASRQTGEIVLRQISRIEDIRPVALPDDLYEAARDARTFVRESALQELEKYLNGNHPGLARSAREALEKMAAEDDSIRVRQAAVLALAPIRQVEQRLDEEKKAQEKAQNLARQKAEEEGMSRKQAELSATQNGAAGPGTENGTGQSVRDHAEGKAQHPAGQMVKGKDILSLFFSSMVRAVLIAVLGTVIVLISNALSDHDVGTNELLFVFVLCGLAGLIMVPHRFSVVFLVLGFLIAGSLVSMSSHISYKIKDFLLFGVAFGFPAAALLSRILSRLKIMV